MLQGTFKFFMRAVRKERSVSGSVHAREQHRVSHGVIGQLGVLEK